MSRRHRRLTLEGELFPIVQNGQAHASALNPMLAALPSGWGLRLPATVVCDEALAIPAGAANVALLGQGCQLVPAPGYTGKLLTVGRTGIDSAIASTEFSGLSSTNVSTPTKGASTLTSTSGSPTTGFRWLAGDTQMASTGIYPEGEIVEVTAVNGSDLTLRDTLKRTYRGAAKLYDISTAMCSNIRIEGIRGYGHNGAAFLDDVFYFGLVDGLTIDGCSVDRYAVRGFSVQACRDVAITNVSVGNMNSSLYGTGGKGYGIQIQRCVDVAIGAGIVGNHNRHLITVHAAANGTIASGTELNGHGTFPDFHGNGEEDWTVSGTSITAASSSGNADTAFGNGNYPYGCSNVALSSHTGGAICYLYAGATTIAVTGVTYTGPLIPYSSSAGRPVSATMTSCTFRGQDIGGVVDGAALRLLNDGATNGFGTLSLVTCVMNDVAGTTPANNRGIYIGNIGADSTLNVNGGFLGLSTAVGTYAMEIDHSGAGTLTIVVSNSPTMYNLTKKVHLAGTGAGTITGISAGDLLDESSGMSLV